MLGSRSNKPDYAHPTNFSRSTDDFSPTIDRWIKALEGYTFSQLCNKPSPTHWSLGQLYGHLIEDTRFYIEQIKICVSTNKNTLQEAVPEAITMFIQNAFPDVQIEGSPSNASIPQPDSKEKLLSDLLSLKEELYAVGRLISESTYNGKTKHPGLGYFSAKEWFQFAEMHFRHHERQKQRIDEFLEKDNHQ